jgi:cell division transport system permease protein
MALKVDYVVKETGKNIIRNPWLSIATVLCVCVSILLVGAALLTRAAASNATEFWSNDVEIVVFMNPDATQEQIDSVQRALDDNPSVASYTYLDHQAAYDEFVELFAEDSPELVESVTPDALPTNFKVQPTEANFDLVAALRTSFDSKPGVREVVAADESIRAIERISNIIGVGMLILAIIITVSALVLIGNTIQTAIFARRREIEVMKLVGATNWFIRIPFMLEGVLQGLIGSALGIGGVYALNSAFDRYIASDEAFDLFSNFTVASSDVFGVAVLLLIGGVLIGAIASAVAVTFYVNV